MSEFIMKASTDEQVEFCRRYSNMQELVRCKDCKKYGDNNKCPIEALINSDSKQFFAFDENWFCADGERKNI